MGGMNCETQVRIPTLVVTSLEDEYVPIGVDKEALTYAARLVPVRNFQSKFFK
jgi:hypothetical protein